MSTPLAAATAVAGLYASRTPEERARRRAVQATVALGLLYAGAVSSTLSGPTDPYSARVDARNLGGAWMCAGHRRLPVVPDAAGFVSLPTGSRVTVGAAGAGRCTPAASFVPQAGQSYRLDVESGAGRCGLTVAREVKSNRLGLGVEPTQDVGEDCLEP